MSRAIELRPEQQRRLHGMRSAFDQELAVLPPPACPDGRQPVTGVDQNLIESTDNATADFCATPTGGSVS
jgi:hypothetical protein